MISKKLLSVAGISAELSSALFFAGMNRLKNVLAELLGLIAAFNVDTGIGPAITITGGMILLFASAVRERTLTSPEDRAKKALPPPPPPQ
ncbi:hypothetical protein [Desulfurococcus amylolyticus]|uniref:hypothetical protein n=1 Tax=Desulfurococcus amylolyticus TaxID=94694 RepID=UPI0018DB4F6A|nr:hypothetical protein [Desulfurococcus amylolyticus]